MDEVLTPLTGVKREQMAMILQNVDTEKLQEAYNRFVGRILKEAVVTPPAALTESTKTTETTVVKTGDIKPLEEEVKPKTATESEKDQARNRMLSLAGVK